MPRLRLFHLLHDVESARHLAEDDMFVVEERRRDRGDEELRTVRVGTCVLQRTPNARRCVSLETEQDRREVIQGPLGQEGVQY